MPVIVQALIAIVAGAVEGLFVPSWFVRIFVSFNDFFGQFIAFLVPLIILALVTASIANAERNAGRMLKVTLVAVFISTFFAGITSLGFGRWLLPLHLHTGEQALAINSKAAMYAPFFTLQLPPALDVMSALMLALMLGLGMRALKVNALRRAITELQSLVMLSIEKTIVPMLPLYIFGVFLKMSAAGGILEMINNFLWVILLVLAMMALWTFVLYFIAGAVGRSNPFVMIWRMMPAGLVAFATCSSAATIPVSLKSATKIARSENAVSFVMPLCANLHVPSVTVHFVICALAVMMMVDQPIMMESFIPFIIMLTFTCVAAPGVPGGVVAVLPVLASVLGFTPEMQAVCLSLGILLDAPLTAVNVLCDGAVCAIVDKAIDSGDAP